MFPSKAAQWAGVYPHSSLALNTLKPFFSTSSSTAPISLKTCLKYFYYFSVYS